MNYFTSAELYRTLNNKASESTEPGQRLQFGTFLSTTTGVALSIDRGGNGGSQSASAIRPPATYHA